MSVDCGDGTQGGGSLADLYSKLTVEELQLVAAAAAVEGELSPMHRMLLVRLAEDMGLFDVEILQLKEKLTKTPLRAPYATKPPEQLRIFKRLAHWLTQRARLDRVGPELMFLGTVGVRWGVDRRRIKTIVRGRMKRHDETRKLVRLDQELNRRDTERLRISKELRERGEQRRAGGGWRKMTRPEPPPSSGAGPRPPAE